jgi:WD40 repeat protein/uncharacterized protein YeeX (DUF496 family)
VQELGVDTQNPWPGLVAFTEELQKYFHGRDEETDELLRRVQRKNLTVLFGQSGLGKSSLLQAGLFPRLRAEGFLPVAIRLDHSAAAPPLSDQVKTAVNRAILDVGGKSEFAASPPTEPLWEHFHRRDLCQETPEGQPIRLVLVLDQFEELFAIGNASEETRARAGRFLTELADLIENRPPHALERRLEENPELVKEFYLGDRGYLALICLREDYLPHLESLRSSMPSIAENRMRLTRMSGSRALDAVVNPAGNLITPEVALEVVRFVAGGRARESGSVILQSHDDSLTGLEVEPSLLSLVCRELNNRRLTLGLPQITTDLLAGNRERILQDFYERCIADQPAAVRAFVEDELITDSGLRENIALERARKMLMQHGASPKAIDDLVQRRLLRVEDRLDIQRVELTHDVLTHVVKQRREQRQQQEAALAAEQRLRQLREKARLQRNRQRALLAAMSAALAIVVSFGAVSYYQYRVSDSLLHQTEEQKKRAELSEQVARQERENALKHQKLAELGEQMAQLARQDALKQKERAEQEQKIANDATRDLSIAYKDLEKSTYVPRIGQAQREWLNGNTQRSDELLDQLSPRFRGWEWNYLKSLAQSYLFALRGHGTMVWSVAYSSDGKYLASGNASGTVEIWDAVTYILVRTLSDHSKSVRDVAFSPNSQLVASASFDKTVKIWNSSSGKLIRTLRGHEDSVNGLSFSPDGKKLASVSTDKTVKVWDVDRGEADFTLDVGGNFSFSGLAFSPNGKSLATGNRAGDIQLWDASTGKPLNRFRTHPGAVCSIAFTRDNQKLISGHMDGAVKVWNTENWSLVNTLFGHTGYITRIAVNRDGTRLASACYDRTVRLWDLRTGLALQTLYGHTAVVNGVAFTSDGRQLAAGSGNTSAGDIKVWNAIWDAGDLPEAPIMHAEQSGPGVAFSADGKLLATCGKRIKVLDARTGFERYILRPAATTSFRTVAFSANGERLAAGSADGQIMVWSSSLEKPAAMTLNGHSGAVQSVVFHPESLILASAGDDGIVRIWDIATGKEIAALQQHTSAVFGLAFSPNGKWLASAGKDRAVMLWNTSTWRNCLTYRGHNYEVHCVSFVTDELIASGDGVVGELGEVRLWSPSLSGLQAQSILACGTIGLLGSCREQRAWLAVSGLMLETERTAGDITTQGMKDAVVLRGHGDTVYGVTVADDRLVTASDDQTVRVWETTTGQELISLPARGLVRSVAFSPDGKRLVSAILNGGVRIWDPPTREVFTLRGHTNQIRCLTYSPDGQVLASAGNAEVKLWDPRTGKQIPRTSMIHKSRADGIAFSPDGKHLVSVGGVLDEVKNVFTSGEVKIWDTATGKEIMGFLGHTGLIRGVAISPNGQYLVTASEDSTVRIWETATGKEVQTLKGHKKATYAVAFSPDGSRVASASGDQTVKVWDVATGALIETLRGHEGSVSTVTFSRDGRWIASAGADRNVILWNARTLAKERTLRGPFAWVVCVSFRPDSSQLASVGDDGLVNAWDVDTGKQVLLFRGHVGFVGAVTYSQDGRYLVSGGDDTTIKIWEVKANQDEVFRVQWGLSQYFRTLKRWTEATALLDNLIDIEPKNANLFNMRGNVYYAREKTAEAMADYTRALDLSPGQSTYFTNRGNCLRKMKDWAGAVEDYTNAVAIEPQDDTAYYWRGWIHYQKGEWKEAIADLTAELEIDPKHANGYLERGICRYRIDELDAAIADFTKALSIDPNIKLARYWRAEAHLQRGEVKQAEKDYAKAIEMDPKYADAYGGRGRARRIAKDFSGAIADFTAALKLSSENALWLYWRGRAHYQNKDLTSSLDDLDRAINLDPKLEFAYLFRGLILFRNGKTAEAARDFNQLLKSDLQMKTMDQGIKLDPQNAPAFLLRGIILLRQGKDAEAKADFDRAFEIQPELEPVLQQERINAKGKSAKDSGDISKKA